MFPNRETSEPKSESSDSEALTAQTRELVARSATLREETARMVAGLEQAVLDAMDRARATHWRLRRSIELFESSFDVSRHTASESHLSDGDIRRRILVVDDERTTRETLAFIFTMCGYDAKCARSAEEAIQMMTKWVPEFTLIDVIMPGMDGIRLAIAIAANHPGCRIVLFTGDIASAQLLMTQHDRIGEFHILEKPVHPTVLLETARRLLCDETAI